MINFNNMIKFCLYTGMVKLAASGLVALLQLP
jgi:hypothetical protein